MQIQLVGVYDYDALRSCPFCNRSGLLSDGNCEHFLAAFQRGTWAPHICPPVSCDGFLFNQDAIVALAEYDGVVCKRKPGTRSHPAIEAYFCSEPGLVTMFKNGYRKVAVPGPKCGECGNKTAVIDEFDAIVCAVCGAPAYLPQPEDASL